jgi:transcriptional antiterminator RfaH
MTTRPEEAFWFAIQSRTGTEAVTASHLRTMEIETLLPLVRRPIRHATRVARMLTRPMFPGYFFARFCPATSLRAVAYSRRVLRVLGVGNRPRPVEETVIESIRTRMDDGGLVTLEERPFRSGDNVRIAEGPLAGWSGVFDRALNDSERVVILVNTLQEGRVVVQRDWLEFSDASN